MYGLAVAAALGPVVVHDSRETSPLASVGSRPGTFATEPVADERTVGEWRQWWLAYARNDRGRWSDPDAWARAARPCTHRRCDEVGECDGRETAITLAAPLVAALTVLGLLRRRSSRHAEHREP